MAAVRGSAPIWSRTIPARPSKLLRMSVGGRYRKYLRSVYRKNTTWFNKAVPAEKRNLPDDATEALLHYQSVIQHKAIKLFPQVVLLLPVPLNYFSWSLSSLYYQTCFANSWARKLKYYSPGRTQPSLVRSVSKQLQGFAFLYLFGEHDAT